MQTGEAQFTFPVSYEVADVLKAKPDLDVVAAPSIVLRYLSMNTQQKPFDNPKVRQAIAYAINKEALAKVAFNGYADSGGRRGAAGRRVRGQAGPVALRRRQGQAAADRGRISERIRDRAVVGLQPHHRAEGHAVHSAAAPADRHPDQDHAARSRAARGKGRELAGPEDGARAPLLRRLVDVDRRGRLGAAPAARRRSRGRRACSTPRTTRTPRSTPTSRARSSPRRARRRRSSTRMRRKRSGTTRRGRRSSSRSCCLRTARSCRACT